MATIPAQNKVGVHKRRSFNPIYSGFDPNALQTAAPWIIPKAQRFGQKIPLYAQYPRPSGEISANSLHLWAHSTMPYIFKPAVAFGCWPYRWTLRTAPAGMYVGNELTRTTVSGLTLHSVDSQYQRITWPGTKSGTYSVVPRCTDQTGAYVEMPYNVTVDDSKFIFVDSNAATDGGSGAINSPKKFLSSVWTPANAGKFVVLRGGTHMLRDGVSTTQFLVSGRPAALMGYPSETVYLDGSEQLIRDANQSAADFVLRDVTLINIKNTDANTYGLQFGGQQNRIILQGITFDNLRTGTVGDSNQSGIVFFDSGLKSQNVVVMDCKLNSNCTISLFISFDLDRILFEGNSAAGLAQPNTNGNGFYNVKDQNNYACLRNNFFRGATSNAHPGRISNQNAAGSYQEHCWNTIITTDTSNCVNWNQARFLAGGGPYFDYANTLASPTGYAHTDALWSPANTTVQVEGMAGYGAGLFEPGLNGYTQGPQSNQLLTSGQLDLTTGKLTGTGAAYRLTHGAELFS